MRLSHHLFGSQCDDLTMRRFLISRSVRRPGGLLIIPLTEAKELRESMFGEPNRSRSTSRAPRRPWRMMTAQGGRLMASWVPRRWPISSDIRCDVRTSAREMGQ